MLTQYYKIVGHGTMNSDVQVGKHIYETIDGEDILTGFISNIDLISTDVVLFYPMEIDNPKAVSYADHISERNVVELLYAAMQKNPSTSDFWHEFFELEE